MQVLRKTQLFSVEEQQRACAWMNDRPMPRIGSAQMAEMVHREVSRFVQEAGEVPVEIRMNPWSIFELPMDRWHRFPFFHEGRIVIIPVIVDAKVVPCRVHCIANEETVLREAVRP